jgi:hypothetical protein
MAGVALLLNGARSLVEQVVGTHLVFSFFLVGLDLVLGVALLFRKPRWRRFAIARALFGGLLFTLTAMGSGDVLLALTEALASASMLGLLLGRPGPLRMMAAGSGFVAGLGMFALWLGPIVLR